MRIRWVVLLPGSCWHGGSHCVGHLESGISVFVLPSKPDFDCPVPSVPSGALNLQFSLRLMMRSDLRPEEHPSNDDGRVPPDGSFT